MGLVVKMVGNKCEHCFTYWCDRCRNDPFYNADRLFTDYQKQQLMLLVTEWYLEWYDCFNVKGNFKKALFDLKLRIEKEEIKKAENE